MGVHPANHPVLAKAVAIAAGIPQHHAAGNAGRAHQVGERRAEVLAETHLGVEQEIVHGVAAAGRRIEAVAELLVYPRQGPAHHGGIIAAGFLAPGLGKGARARVQPGGQRQRKAQLFRRRRRCLGGSHRGHRGVLDQLAHRRVGLHRVVARQLPPFRRFQRQVQRDQVALVRGLHGHFVADRGVPRLPRWRRHGNGRLPAAPGLAVELPQHLAAPVEVLALGLHAAEAHAQGRGIVGEQIHPFVGRHSVAEAAAPDGVVGQSPDRAGQSGEKPESGHRQRQRHRHGQPDGAGAASVHARGRDPGAMFGQKRQGQQEQCGGRQGQCEGQRSLVLQEGRERREHRKAQKAAGVAQAVRLEGLERQQCRQHRAAGIAPDAEAVAHDDVAGQRYQQGQPGSDRQGSRHDDAGKRHASQTDRQQRRDLQQQGQQAGQGRGHAPGAQPGVQEFGERLRHGASGPAHADRRGDVRGRCPGRPRQTAAAAGSGCPAVPLRAPNGQGAGSALRGRACPA